MTETHPRKRRRSRSGRERQRTGIRHAVFLAVALIGVFFVGAAEFGPNNIVVAQARAAVAIKRAVIAALEDPLALLAERSPGRRGVGALHLTKSVAVPHERVLAEERLRPIQGPVVDIPILPDAPAAAAAPSAPGNGPESPTGNSPTPSFTSPLPAFPGLLAGGGPGIGAPFGNPGGILPQNPPAGGPAPDNTNSPPSDNPVPPGGDMPPPGGPDAPPGGGNPPADTPPTIVVVPEPATLPLMIFGLLAVVLIVYRNKRRS